MGWINEVAGRPGMMKMGNDWRVDVVAVVISQLEIKAAEWY